MDGAQRLAQVFVELAYTLVEEFDVVVLLQMLTERCVELLHADAAGLMLADERGNLRLMASSTERMRLVELFELQVDEGPCRDCYLTGRAVTNVSLSDANDRWPVFTAAAMAAGFDRTHALPMRLRGRVIGALNLFTDEPVDLSDDDIAVGQAMADVATIGLLNERAKGVLAARAGVGVDAAFTRMRDHARHTGPTLTSVATAVVDGSLEASVLLGT